MEELIDLLESCNPKPVTAFRFAIEESEAWLLGDPFAAELAYPRAKQAILDTYVQDSICGTWELLADAIHERGAVDLVRRGYPDIGIAKCEWAERIGRLVDIQRNQSPSFAKFREAVRSFAGAREVP